MKYLVVILCMLCCIIAAVCSPLLPLGCVLFTLSEKPVPEAADTPDQSNQSASDRNTPIIQCSAAELVISVYENQAIPYRYESNVSGAVPCVELASEETVHEPGFPFASGDAPARHVFTYRWLMDGEGKIILTNMRIKEYRDDPDDQTDYAEKHIYVISRYDGVARINEETDH